MSIKYASFNEGDPVLVDSLVMSVQLRGCVVVPVRVATRPSLACLYLVGPCDSEGSCIKGLADDHL